MKILIRSTSKIYSVKATNNLSDEIKVLVTKISSRYDLSNTSSFGSFKFDKSDTLYRLPEPYSDWGILFEIYSNGGDINRRYHEELHKILLEILKLPRAITLQEATYYFTKSVCETNKSEQYDAYKKSSTCVDLSDFDKIHNILLPKVIEYYS